ncbi:MAG: bifunctional UDP-N-acetylglucosamine diphosphorylase/glucosamine-1-phosphate N-acetyltransferase GlmU, partial [Chloroflexi bacterium]|nr:bifunctional UDP-N-acetylglucosamine diphosphorylase/glucosamine-1-phosphate N-acetyltransferase GlmU [Chloroflexota bacterium]
CGREMLGLVADTALQSGLSPVVAVLPPDCEDYLQALGDSVSHVVQEEPLGTGHAALQARERLSTAETVVILCGDVPLIRTETIQALVDKHVETEATLTLLTSNKTNPDGLGRVVRSTDGSVSAIVEQRVADSETLAITEINSGVYCFHAQWLWESLPKLAPSAIGEIFLTDLVAMAVSEHLLVESVQVDDGDEVLGVNTRIELARVDGLLRRRIRERWMLEGVSMPDPDSVYIDLGAQIGMDSVILPNTHVRGTTVIGEGCEIGPNSIVSDSSIGSNCKITASVVDQAILENSVSVGPFSHMRPGAYLESDVHIGNYGEVKNSRLGKGTKSGHFSYIGDADVGAGVNIGAGSITCNFDGENKNRTIIEDGAFIGSDTMLVAPVRIGANARTGVGSVVTKDVPAGSSAIGAPARIFTNRQKQPKKEVD